jgi:hypothetical protein
MCNYLNALLGAHIISILVQYISGQSTCICTTVPCPQEGINNIIMGNGHAKMEYNYILQNDIPVVSLANGILDPQSLDNGSETTTCTRKYARMLEDDGADNCDAGHILAHRLGGYGNEPLNIFPQNSTINQGSFNQFESKIYACMQNSTQGQLHWEFYYSEKKTQPYKVIYSAYFENSYCEPLYKEFTN